MPQRATTAQRAQPAQAAQGSSEIRVPTNEAELNALGHLRGELRSQISTITVLRQELTNQVAQAMATGDNASVGKLQARIRSLETRSATIEQQLLQVDDAVTTAIARGVGTAPSEVFTAVPVGESPAVVFGPTGMVDEDIFASVLVGMTLLFTFLGVLVHRRAWRRAEKKYAAAGSGSRAELQQLQQAVDVIAVEVERISEGQRFVSKLLNERLESASLPDGRDRVPAVLKDADATARSR
jgi:hypothetical protein